MMPFHEFFILHKYFGIFSLFIFKSSKLKSHFSQNNSNKIIIIFAIPDDRRRGDAERVRHDRQRPWQASEAVPAPDLRYDPLPSEQQGCQGPAAGGRPHLSHRRHHEDVQRGEADGALGGRPLRVPGRGVPRGPGLHPRRTQGHRQRHRHDQDEPAHQRLAAQVNCCGILSICCTLTKKLFFS